MKKAATISIVLAFALIPVFTNQVFSQIKTSQTGNNEVPYLCEEDWIEVMFVSESKVRMRNDNLTDLSLTDALSGVDQLLSKLSWHNWYRFCNVPESTIDQWETNGERNSGIDVYNLNNIYRLQIPKGQDVWNISRELENLPGIYKAGPVPKPMELPTPPNYQSNQGYLNNAASTPTGIDALYAWTKTGGTGSGVTVCDLEYSWNYNHADISKAAGSQINSNVQAPSGTTNDHGTAVIGELVADNNGWGTTGICYGAGLKTCGTYYGSSPQWNVPGAMAVAIANLSAGDIILLEQQWEYTSGSSDFIPIEWWMNYSPNAQTNNGVYAAIVNAVTNGIHVVEAGGNGSVNTDNLTWYGNSGAIIVGAGGAYSGGSWPNGDLQKLGFSSYGQRFDLQGWGENVVTTGYGDLYSSQGTNYWYTNTFNGTSSASPIVAGAVACTQGYYLSNISSTPMTPSAMRTHLITYGTAQITPPNGNIGPRPDLKNAIDNIQIPSNWDWGDAPDPPYQTLANYGATHKIGPLFLGASIDGDANGQPTNNADGDDNDGNDDEDGITFNGPLFPGGTVSVTVVASQSGFLQGWIDFDQNGSWGDPGEQIFTDVGLTAGTNNLTFTVPMTAKFGPTYSRFRLSSAQGLLFYGSVNDGEVEDYLVNIEEGGGDIDWGDAPDQPYPTLSASNGANHTIDGVTYLGNSVDGDIDGQPTAIADGDDNDGNDDEDGVTFTSPIVPGQMATVDIVASVQGVLNAWIDFDGNGFWGDPGEQIFLDFTLAAGANIGLSFNVPPTAMPGQSFARFRFCSQPGLNFDGHAPDGEVEDYEVEITGENYKWEQLPDLSNLGMDVNAVDPVILADDFECTMTGPITRIQIWGSWLSDYFPWYEDPSAVTFTLSIHGDIPDTVTGDYSMPDTVLWMRTFLQGEFTYDFFASNLNEGWFDPSGNFYDPNGDSQCLLYTFDIDSGNFIQTGTPDKPVIYWLDVQAQPEDPDSQFGWKTSETHWNDDGVWGLGQEPKNDSLWEELIYPQGHELQGQSIDLAFRITGEEIQSDYDYGDAPDPNYPTLAASNGASHFIDGVTYLGSQVDGEPDGQPDSQALGDDNDILYPPANDDEDGVTFTSSLFIGNSATMDVVASVSANLSVWIDFNADGDWADPGEQIFADYATVSGINSLMFNIPASATLGQTYMRFRFSNQTALNFDNPAQDGEVEDYMVEIKEEVQDEYDWGDASDPSYPTLAANNGANHIIDGITFMGASVDAEPDGQQDPNALGDDNDGNDDEDGIIFGQIIQGSPAQITITTSTAGYLQGWMDFNADGDWADPGEQIFTDTYIHFGSTLCLNYIVPANAAIGTTYARFRFSSATGISYTGNAPDGEVEDYEVEITQNPDIKWSQEPCTYLSGLHCADSVEVIADDWQCNGGLVTDIHWWGSYENNLIAGGINYFHLSIHNNDPANCLPLNPEIWGVNVPITATNETNSGLINSSGEIIYEYAYYLNIPFEQTEGNTYWLDICAYSNDTIDPAVWTWQESSRTTSPVLCPAASYAPPWQSIVWSTPPPVRFSDMAFVITSEEPVEEYDWGDASDPTYPTLAINSGANHLMDGLTYMGASVDAEPDGQQDPNALGDDNDGNDDEDGVTFVWPCVPGNPVKVIVNASVSNGYLSAWFDFNQDGDWADVGEQIFTDVPLAAGNNTLNFIVPANATIGTTYTRFRFSTVTGLTYTGSAPDGEVEDYEVEIEENGDNKWAQWPDPSLSGLHTHDYNDVSGLYHSLVNADDWLCSGGLVTDIHWWGNYELDGNNAEKRGAGIDHFHLSIHANDPSCLPIDPELWGVDVPFSALVEQNTGMTNNESSTIYLYEYILNQPFVQDSGTYYWLDITAISIDPNNPAIWRWQESMRSANPILCGAAEKDQPVPDIWNNVYWSSTNLYTDMAFIITSTEYEYDFGDANDPSYPTLLASDGARHILDGVTFLGNTIDAEPNGLPDPNALGDDNNNTDDEDGVTFTSSLMPGQNATVTVTASVPGLLNAWIDFNGNGSWGDIGEQVFNDVTLVAGLNNLTFNVPLTATVGTTYARFRFSTASGLTYTGVAPDGEVEDYEVEIIESNIKWSQEPDPTLTGVHAHDYDNAGTYEDIVVADDWKCEGGWVTDIHWWGAYDNDGNGNEMRGLGIDHFHLSIHLNDTVACLPVDPEVWGMDVPFITLIEINTGMINSDGDTIYLYEFDLPEPFQQIEGQRYWLDLTAISVDYNLPALWKWQLSSIGSPPALCGAADKVIPSPDVWNTMYFNTELLGDMAFVITSEPAPDMDFGDAYDPTYPTLLTSDGARHIIDGVTYLGNLIDAEPNGQPDPNALGDDNNNLADEDGVSIWSSFYAGGSAMINITASVNGILNAWIDYNNDGDWNDANEQIFTDQSLNAGGNMFVISVPNNAIVGTTFARYRFSTASGLQPTGIAPDGEVEDYEIEILGDLDFGDAPDPSYPTLMASNGARHLVDTTIFLGNAIDVEPDGLQDANALGDDNNNLDDEDGVALPPVIVLAQQNVVTVTASASGYINAWIDFNMNGSWADPEDQIFTDQAVTAGANTLIFMGPPTINYGTSFARFRFSTIQGLSFTGQAPDGEVEDYEVEIGPAYKWIQEPDLSDLGMDVNATLPNLLADDFRCTVTGPITTISVWGSWFKDHIPWHEDPNEVTFTLSIHEDIPADQSPTGYSMPGNTIWLHTFAPTEFTVEVEAAGLSESWYDPVMPFFDPIGDTVCWKYIFDLVQYAEPFIQTGTPDEPVIYWLDVQAQPLDDDPECMFGWKTSQQHFNDDAVWATGNEPYNGDWNEMHYPPEHLFAGQSVDLAFSIEGQEDPFILVDLTALLEGPYNGTIMTTDLNNSGLIPLSQPYNMDATAKWYYTGAESVYAVPDSVTDWILVELRDAPSASTAYGTTRIAQRAAFVLDNGTIVATDGSSMLKFYTSFTNNPYVVLWHRNHLGILSNNPMNQPTTGVYTYDFTTGSGQAYLNGQKDLGSGVYGMYGGDAAPDGLIDSGDKSVWTNDAGTTGYLQSDFNMDTQVDNNDKNDVWVPNISTGTQVPN